MPSIPDFITTIWPELTLIAVACILFLLGIARSPAVRKFIPIIALLTLAAIFFCSLQGTGGILFSRQFPSIRSADMAQFLKMISSGITILFVLLAWPSNKEATGNAALEVGMETGEFFALMLLSIAGLFLVFSANDIILLFLGIELASIPTYIMVSVSRPLPQSQEAGVKYFFLGAMSAAIMLFGFSYLYGTTGMILLNSNGDGASIADIIARSEWHLTGWQTMSLVMLLCGFAFKMAAVPLHFYVADVYQGAATPVTAFLSYVPKASGLVAIIKILSVFGGPEFILAPQILHLLYALAVLTMTVGNVLATVQPHNIKRVLAYSSVAHSGYLLTGVTTALYCQNLPGTRTMALAGILFYLVAYGIMNAGAFGVLQLLPTKARSSAAGTPTGGDSAETFDDIAGQAKHHPVLGLAMATCCFSLIGLPLTVGFFGKVFLIKPALDAHLYGLVVLIMINAAISAAYYLRIVAAMYLRPESQASTEAATMSFAQPKPIMVAVALSAIGTLALGIILPVTTIVAGEAAAAAKIDIQIHGIPAQTAMANP
jgi:NADH-quinone oxidoreductase subunit N